VFENGVLWRKFEPKREEVTGGWRKLNIEELHNLCSSPDIVRIITFLLRYFKEMGHECFICETTERISVKFDFVE
jgi:hypothetical protein